MNVRYRNAIWTALTLAVLLSAAPSARAQFLNSLRPELQWQYDDLESSMTGVAVQHESYASLNYTLSYRGAITPGTSLWSNLTLKASQTGDYESGQQTGQGIVFNMFWNEPEYTLMGRIDTSRYTTDYSEPLPTLSTGRVSIYSAGVLLRMPAYPAVSIQYQENVNSSSANNMVSDYTTSNCQFSAQYALHPLEFTYDEQNQGTSSGCAQTSSTVMQRSSVQLDTPLLPNLGLVTELSRVVNGSANWGATTLDSGLIRVTAQPTSAVMATVDLEDQDSIQPTLNGQTTSNNQTMTANIRTQFLPGVGLEFTDQVQDQFLVTDGVSSDYSIWNTQTELSTRLTDATLFQAGLTESGSAPLAQPQSSLECGIVSQIRPTTNVSINVGRDSLVSDAQDWTRDTLASIGIQDRTTTRLTLGGIYRLTDTNSETSPEPSTTQRLNELDLDALWEPVSAASLDMRLDWLTNTGSQYSSSIAPDLNFRWRIASRTEFAANYNLISERIQSTIGSSSYQLQQNDTSSITITQRFLDGSSLNFLYNYLDEIAGTNEWQKQFQIQYNMKY